MKKENLKRGPKTKFDTLNLEQIKKLVLAGWTDEKISDFFGIGKQSFITYKKNYPELGEAIKDWKLEADEKVEKSLYERALGYSHKEDVIMQFQGKPVIVPTIKHYPPDTTACIFWLKNRKQEEWRDRKEVEHSGNLNISDLLRDADNPQAETTINRLN